MGALVIASSTGGPAALIDFFEQLAPEFAWPIFVVQHFPASLTSRFARDLGAAVKRVVAVAEMGQGVTKHQVLLAPGGYHMRIAGNVAHAWIELDREAEVNYCRPSADPLFATAASVYRSHLIGLVFTGLGCDGTRGAREIISAGGLVFTQDSESSAAPFMPASVRQSGLSKFDGSPRRLAVKCNDLFRQNRRV